MDNANVRYRKWKEGFARWPGRELGDRESLGRVRHIRTTGGWLGMYDSGVGLSDIKGRGFG